MSAPEIVTWIAAAGAIVAWFVALLNALAALRETRKAPGGDAIVRQFAYAWLFAARKMPPQAQPYVKRLWLAIFAFMGCVVTGVLAGLFRAGMV